MSFAISSTGKQYIFASFNTNNNNPWMFSFKRFILTEGDMENYHVGPVLRGQFISSGWFSQIIKKNDPQNYLFMVIEFEGDFSYQEDHEGSLIPSIVTEIKEVMQNVGVQNDNKNFIVDNCLRATNAFLFDFEENIYKNAFELKNDGDRMTIKMTDSKNNNGMNLVVNVRKIIENGKHSIYISNPEFIL